MDHLTPGFRSRRLQRRRELLTATWALLGLVGSLLVILCAVVAPEALVIAGLLGGLMFGSTRR